MTKHCNYCVDQPDVDKVKDDEEHDDDNEDDNDDEEHDDDADDEDVEAEGDDDDDVDGEDEGDEGIMIMITISSDKSRRLLFYMKGFGAWRKGFDDCFPMICHLMLPL